MCECSEKYASVHSLIKEENCLSVKGHVEVSEDFGGSCLGHLIPYRCGRGRLWKMYHRGHRAQTTIQPVPSYFSFGS